MTCAVLNILIPLELGALVNVVSVLQSNKQLSDYIKQLLPRGIRLTLLYASQVSNAALALGGHGLPDESSLVKSLSTVVYYREL